MLKLWLTKGEATTYLQEVSGDTSDGSKTSTGLGGDVVGGTGEGGVGRGGGAPRGRCHWGGANWGGAHGSDRGG